MSVRPRGHSSEKSSAWLEWSLGKRLSRSPRVEGLDWLLERLFLDFVRRVPTRRAERDLVLALILLERFLDPALERARVERVVLLDLRLRGVLGVRGMA